MNDVYRSVPDARRLVPRERDPVTGRRTRDRDEKRRRNRRPRPRSRLMVGAAVGFAVLLVGGVAFAVTRGGGDDRAVSATSGADESGSGGSAGSGAKGGTTTVTDPPATAISLSYSGGTQTKKVCSDVKGTECSNINAEFVPLTVRCTPSGCTVGVFGEAPTVPLVAGAVLSGSIAPPDGVCQPTVWNITLNPVGSKETHGIKHPARITGSGTANRPAELIGARNCLGSDEAYTYDAVPQ